MGSASARQSDGSVTEDEVSVTRRLDIVNEKGLHARASARFVETVERFDARGTVSR